MKVKPRFARGKKSVGINEGEKERERDRKNNGRVNAAASHETI